MAVNLDTTATYKLSKESYFESSLRVNEVKFGDGYKQTVQDGINADEDKWFLSFLMLPLASAVTLETLLKNSKNGTANVLSWTPPGGSSVLYWEATNIRRSPSNGVKWKVSCTLERVYPLTV